MPDEQTVIDELVGGSRPRRSFGRLLDAAYGLVQEEGDTEEYRLQKSIAVVASFVGAPLTAISALVATRAGAGALEVGVLIAYAAAIAVFIAFFIRTRRGFQLGFNGLLMGNLGVAAISLFSRGGIVQAGAGTLWGIIPSILALLAFGRRSAIRWFAAFIGLQVVALAVGEGPSADTEIRAAFGSTLIGVPVFLFLMFLYFTRERDRAEAEARRERARSDALLRNVLPEEIVARLKAGEQVIADDIPEATVVFADIADFTPMSATMSADELVELLDEVFRSFDALSLRYGLEKIKTIGDCYMVAAGVPDARPDHAAAAAAMALDMRDLVEATDFRGRKLRFRIGIHSGPLVAGVIGDRKFIYDLWGDTVNTASRMESHGVAGAIQITEATRRLLDGRFVTTSRGPIDVKGKGPMTVFFLDRGPTDADSAQR